MSGGQRSGDDDESDERSFFLREMQGVKSLPRDSRGRVPLGPRGAPPALTATRVRTRGAVPQASPLLPGSGGGPLLARAADLDERTASRFAKGEVRPEVTLDLHGLTEATALRRLEADVPRRRREGARCLLVVHGRGLHSGSDGPILLNAVRAALRTPPLSAHVLAIAAAPSRWGGEGATLVWVRR